MNIYRALVIRILQVGLVAFIAGAGWMLYKRLPNTSEAQEVGRGATALQIIMERTPETAGARLDVTVDFYPVDIVAVGHEFFSELRPGEHFPDFLKERMKGRSPVNTRLNAQGMGSVNLPPGNWWLHAKLSGDEELEWRLPVKVTGAKQTLELNAQNAYTRSKAF